jgi:hypothetical protein
LQLGYLQHNIQQSRGLQVTQRVTGLPKQLNVYEEDPSPNWYMKKALEEINFRCSFVGYKSRGLNRGVGEGRYVGHPSHSSLNITER